MQFLVVGTDGPAFVHEPCDLHERHQEYMDGWRDELVARGPLLSPDGEQHIGSVHVVDVANETVARRFATDEPFAGNGWYSEVVVVPVHPCLPGTMWDRPRRAAALESAFVRAAFASARSAEQVADAVAQHLAESPDQRWPYVGVIRDGEQGSAVGLVGLLDLSQNDALRVVEQLVVAATGSAPTELETHRWQRGGRQQQG